MSFAVKEMFLTLQGEGINAGRRAVFLRFAGCNLWSGREEDRATAQCTFCDTDFVGMDGEEGGRYECDALVDKAAALWGNDPRGRLIVMTGGEPMLQVTDDLVDALHDAGFEVAMESNGTLAAAPGIDWVTISPKAGTEVVQRSGAELKLVWPQRGVDPEAFRDWAFDHFLIQPMDGVHRDTWRAEALRYVMDHPGWRLSVQTHKMIGIP
ncbi:7-carboxy-7-deazaguanine synthase [Sphingomonas oryzagri]